MLKDDNADNDYKKQYLQTQPGNQDDSDDGQSIEILEQSHYYESNGELFCVDVNQGNTLQQKSLQRVDSIKKVNSIANHYKISYESEDVLGNGAFAMVRICQKVIDQVTGIDHQATTLKSKKVM